MRQFKIALEDGGVRTLGEVRYVPKLRENLISLGTIHENDYSLRSEENRDILRVSKGAMTVMRAKTTPGNIYKFLGSPVVGDIASVESANETTRLWHMRFGHPSEKGMEKFHKRNLLAGVKNCTIGLCKYCIMGKQCRVSFTTRKHTIQGILD